MTRSQFGLFRFKGHSNRDPLSRCRLDTRPVQSRSVKVPGDQSVNLPCISTIVEMQRTLQKRAHLLFDTRSLDIERVWPVAAPHGLRPPPVRTLRRPDKWRPTGSTGSGYE